MSIKTWISSFFGRKKKISKEMPPQDEMPTNESMDKELMGLNFKTAVEAHQN